MNAENSCLLLVDVQEKLIPLIHEHQNLISNCHWLLTLANELSIPSLASEHYPKGLGETISDLKSLVAAQSFMIKTHFSCISEPSCFDKINLMPKSQFIVMGIEAHVCVLQTAMELLQQDKQVFVVVDAVSSRALNDKKYALKRMQQMGIQCVTKEMVFFEWLKSASHPRFKELSKKFL